MTDQDIKNLESLAVVAIRGGLFHDLQSVVQIADSIVALKRGLETISQLSSELEEAKKIIREYNI